MSEICRGSFIRRWAKFEHTCCKKSRYARYGEGEAVVERELINTDVESIESVGAIGAVFEQVFFALCELFAGFVFTEAVAASAYSG